MNTRDRNMVVGVFDEYAQAKVAVDRLWHAGFAHEEVGIAGPGEPVREAQTAEGKVEDTAARGAVTGAIAGGGVGAVAGALATGLIPGIGPVVAGGLLLGIITGAAAGAAGGTFLGPFIALGFTEEEARYYEKEFHAGRTIVTVRADARVADAVTILRGCGAHDINQRLPEEVVVGQRR